MDGHFRKSFASIANQVGIDEETVRHRIRRLHEDGFITDWRTIVNPAIVGSSQYILIFDVSPVVSKDDVIATARLVPGMFLIVRFHGPLVATVLQSYDGTATRKHIEILRRLAQTERMSASKVPFPPCTIQLRKSDWDVLRALRGDPRKPCSAVATELGCSPRTIKRRLDRLVRGGAVFAFPALDPNAARGVVIAMLIVTYDPEWKAILDAEITAKLDTYIWHVFHMLPSETDGLQSTGFNLALPNVGRSAEILRWARFLPGLVDAKVGLYEDVETIFDVFDEEIERRIVAPA